MQIQRIDDKSAKWIAADAYESSKRKNQETIKINNKIIF